MKVQNLFDRSGVAHVSNELGSALIQLRIAQEVVEQNPQPPHVNFAVTRGMNGDGEFRIEANCYGCHGRQTFYPVSKKFVFHHCRVTEVPEEAIKELSAAAAQQ